MTETATAPIAFAQVNNIEQQLEAIASIGEMELTCKSEGFGSKD